MTFLFSRRQMLRASTLAATAAVAAGTFAPLVAASAKRRFKIGACDWSIGKTSDPAGFELARELGLDGLQVSLGTAGNDMHLRQKEVQERYHEVVRRTGLEIGSLAIGELNNIPYKSDARAEKWVEDCIPTAQALKAPVVLLAFFGNGDLRDDQPGVDEVVRRLRKVAPAAEKAGVTLGIESWLSAEQQLEIMDRVGSKAVKVYYDVCNSNDRGYDIYKEIRHLGRDRICEFHAKENGTLLGQGKVDFKRVRAAFEDIGYEGWVQIEGAVPSGMPMIEAYKKNREFLSATLG